MEPRGSMHLWSINDPHEWSLKGVLTKIRDLHECRLRLRYTKYLL